jgi:hypothetical protein
MSCVTLAYPNHEPIVRGIAIAPAPAETLHRLDLVVLVRELV